MRMLGQKKSHHRWFAPAVFFMLVCAAVFCVSPSGTSQAAVHVLDHFDNGPESAIVAVTGFDDNWTTTTAAIGPYRYISLNVVASGGTPTLQSGAIVTTTGGGRYDFATPPFAKGTGTIDWFGQSGAPGAGSCMPTPVNLFSGPLAGQKFYTTPLQVEHSFELCMDVYFGNPCTGPYTQCQTVTPADVGSSVEFPFSGFGVPLSSFQSVGRIRMYWTDESVSLDWATHELGDNCTTPAPTIHELTATPSSVPSGGGTVNICYRVESPDGNATHTTVTVTPGGFPLSPLVADNAQHCADYAVSCPGGSPLWTMKAVGQCDNDTAPLRILCGTERVPGLSEWGMIILALVMAVSAIVTLRRRRNVG